MVGNVVEALSDLLQVVVKKIWLTPKERIQKIKAKRAESRLESERKVRKWKPLALERQRRRLRLLQRLLSSSRAREKSSTSEIKTPSSTEDSTIKPIKRISDVNKN